MKKVQPFTSWSKKLEERLLDKNTKPSHIFTLTKNIDEHPEEWDGPCFCKGCQSCCD